MNTFIDCCYYCRYYHQSIYTWHQCNEKFSLIFMFSNFSNEILNLFLFDLFFSAHVPPPAIYTPTPSTTTYSQSYAFSTNSINRNNNNNNNNNNTILNVQSIYPSLPLNQFSTILTSNKNLTNVCHSPLSTSSFSSFDEQPPPPVKPRLSLRPQLPPPPPPPPLPVSTFPSSIPQFRGPTRPAPKPPTQIQTEQQQVERLDFYANLCVFFIQLAYRMINNPFEKNFQSDETSSTRNSCDLETSSTRTDFFDLELKNLHGKNSISSRLFFLVKIRIFAC